MPAPSKAQGFVYAVQANWMIKIGWAADVRRRVVELQCGSPLKLNVVFIMPGTGEDERGLQFRFHKFRRHGEWFEADDSIISHLHNLRRTKGRIVRLASVIQSIYVLGDDPRPFRGEVHGTIYDCIPPEHMLDPDWVPEPKARSAYMAAPGQ